MLALIDNYDSFTYNLYQYLCELGQEVEVVRNDKTSLEEIASWDPERIIVSPGPCTPKEAGISVDVIRHFGSRLPVLGVCLGHQCIGTAYGGVVGYAGEIMHGKSSMVHHDGKGVYRRPVQTHSKRSGTTRWPYRKKDSLTAWRSLRARANGIIMGVRHKEYPVEGFQAHPESIMTPEWQGPAEEFPWARSDWFLHRLMIREAIEKLTRGVGPDGRRRRPRSWKRS